MNALYRRYKSTLCRPGPAITVSVAAALAMAYLYGCLCEYVRAGTLARTLPYLQRYWLQIAFGAAVTALLFLFFTLLTARPWVGNAAVGTVLCVMSWVSRQKLTYRGDPLLPKDLFAAADAANIARRMQLDIPHATRVFAAVVLIATLLLWPVRLPLRAWAQKHRRPRLVRAGVALAPVAALALYFATVLYNEPLMLGFGIYLSRVSFADTYYRGSFVTSFCTQTASLFPMPAPDGYGEDGVADALALAPAAENGAGARRCDVFVVLLESYFFLDNYDTAVISEPLTTNFDRLKAEGISGQMLSSGYGGGTANIEFSVLSGYLNNFLPAGSFPYMEYVKDGFLCYPQYLKAQGYHTLAVHPYTNTYYNRNVAYPQMGIDTFVAEEAFSPADIVGEYTGEQATLGKTLELYRQAAQDGAPVFVHVVTMQNHGPNLPGKYPASEQVTATTPEADASHNGSLTSIATGLRDIDAAIGAFCDALRGADRDAVVLFFGDHQASVNGSGGYNGNDLLGSIASYQALPADEQALRSHVTPYLMWANFETGHEGEDAGLLPSHMLLPVMLDAFNVTRPAWFDWLLAANRTLDALDYDLYFTAVPELLQKMSPEQQRVYKAEEMLQYDLMFGQQYAAGALYGATP